MYIYIISPSPSLSLLLSLFILFKVWSMMMMIFFDIIFWNISLQLTTHYILLLYVIITADITVLMMLIKKM